MRGRIQKEVMLKFAYCGDDIEASVIVNLAVIGAIFILMKGG